MIVAAYCIGALIISIGAMFIDMAGPEEQVFASLGGLVMALGGVVIFLAGRESKR